MFPPSYDLKLLFEELNERVDKPIEYNHLISRLFSQVLSSQIIMIGDIPMINDPVRGKLISVSRNILTSAYYGKNQSSRYLRIDGVTTAGSQGVLMSRNGLITAMSAKSRSIGSWTFEVRKNNIPITLVGLTVSGSFGNAPVLDVEFNAGDYLQFFLSGNGVDHPICSTEIAWRE